MIRRPPVSTRTDTLFPYTTLFRSLAGLEVEQVVAKRQIQQLALPAKQSVFGIELAGIFRIGWRVVGQVRRVFDFWHGGRGRRSEEHTSELQSLMRISYAVFCLKKKK